MDADDICQFIYECIAHYEDNLPDGYEPITKSVSAFTHAGMESNDDGLVIKTAEGETFYVKVNKK